MADTPSTTDQAIERCETIIGSHRRKAYFVFILLFGVTSIFLMLIGLPLVRNYYGVKEYSGIPVDSSNGFINKLNAIDSLSVSKYDTAISKAITFQKLLNTKEELKLAILKSSTSQKNDLSSFILYGVFILIFGILASFYRFHLKEISRQEHFLLGFHRIRIAAVNSSTKYDDEVLKALTKDAFYLHTQVQSSKSKLESPLQGHPGSDAATKILNKVLEQIEVTLKPKQP